MNYTSNSSIVKEGWVEIGNLKGENWRKRFFLLTSNTFTCYAKSTKSDDDLEWSLLLSNVEITDVNESFRRSPTPYLLRAQVPIGNFIFSVASKFELDAWKIAFSEAKRHLDELQTHDIIDEEEDEQDVDIHGHYLDDIIEPNVQFTAQPPESFDTSPSTADQTNLRDKIDDMTRQISGLQRNTANYSTVYPNQGPNFSVPPSPSGSIGQPPVKNRNFNTGGSHINPSLLSRVLINNQLGGNVSTGRNTPVSRGSITGGNFVSSSPVNSPVNDPLKSFFNSAQLPQTVVATPQKPADTICINVLYRPESNMPEVRFDMFLKKDKLRTLPLSKVKRNLCRTLELVPEAVSIRIPTAISPVVLNEDWMVSDLNFTDGTLIEVFVKPGAQQKFISLGNGTLPLAVIPPPKRKARNVESRHVRPSSSAASTDVIQSVHPEPAAAPVPAPVVPDAPVVPVTTEPEPVSLQMSPSAPSPSPSPISTHVSEAVAFPLPSHSGTPETFVSPRSRALSDRATRQMELGEIFRSAVAEDPAVANLSANNRPATLAALLSSGVKVPPSELALALSVSSAQSWFEYEALLGSLLAYPGDGVSFEAFLELWGGAFEAAVPRNVPRSAPKTSSTPTHAGAMYVPALPSFTSLNSLSQSRGKDISVEPQQNVVAPEPLRPLEKSETSPHASASLVSPARFPERFSDFDASDVDSVELKTKSGPSLNGESSTVVGAMQPSVDLSASQTEQSKHLIHSQLALADPQAVTVPILFSLSVKDNSSGETYILKCSSATDPSEVATRFGSSLGLSEEQLAILQAQIVHRSRCLVDQRVLQSSTAYVSGLPPRFSVTCGDSQEDAAHVHFKTDNGKKTVTAEAIEKANENAASTEQLRSDVHTAAETAASVIKEQMQLLKTLEEVQNRLESAEKDKLNVENTLTVTRDLLESYRTQASALEKEKAALLERNAALEAELSTINLEKQKIELAKRKLAWDTYVTGISPNSNNDASGSSSVGVSVSSPLPYKGVKIIDGEPVETKDASNENFTQQFLNGSILSQNMNNSFSLDQRQWSIEKKELLAKANADKLALAEENRRLRTLLDSNSISVEMELRGADELKAQYESKILALQVAKERTEAELQSVYKMWEDEAKRWATERLRYSVSC